MRNRLLVLPAVTAGLLIVATAVTAAAARPARNTAGPGVLTTVARPRPGRWCLSTVTESWPRRGLGAGAWR